MGWSWDQEEQEVKIVPLPSKGFQGPRNRKGQEQRWFLDGSDYGHDGLGSTLSWMSLLPEFSLLSKLPYAWIVFQTLQSVPLVCNVPLWRLESLFLESATVKQQRHNLLCCLRRGLKRIRACPPAVLQHYEMLTELAKSLLWFLKSIQCPELSQPHSVLEWVADRNQGSFL